uniref:Anoctamin n=1 Tax=Romanomermis culicivorax TaxID=13658 RepID=A0A915HJG7_ROMCU
MMSTCKHPKILVAAAESEEQQCGEDHCIRQKLKASWATWGATTKRQPLNRVTEYFGEKIGFYFAFMDCYTKMLIFPSAVGLLVLLYGLIYASNLQEIDNICKPLHTTSGGNVAHGASNTHHRRKRSSTAAATNNNSVADLWMCPICEPPGCEPWEMYIEGCSQYQWAFRLDNEASILLSSCVILW